MRASREEAAQGRAKIVELAGQQFREHGFDGIGIARLMEAAGRTHGGFYKLFEDKQALMAEATAAALAGNGEKWDEIMSEATGDPVEALRRWYLSPPHVDRRADGCAYAALAAEAPRHSHAVREAFEKGLEASIARISGEFADGESRTIAIGIIAQMIGTLILARAVESSSLKTEIMRAGSHLPCRATSAEGDR